MVRSLGSSLSLMALVVFCVAAAGQSNSGEVVTLGQSSVPLYGPWKFTVGDSPLDAKTGKPLWAEPEFDDSHWENVDLKPKDGALDAVSGMSGFVPGWTALGHPGHWGYAWYRLKVNVQSQPGEELALAGPADVDDVYQAFSNGEFVGQFGDFSRNPPVGYYSQPMMFSLRGTGNEGAAGGAGISTRVLAFRVFMFPTTLTTESDTGGLHNAPLLGYSAAVGAAYHMSWLESIRGYAVMAVLIPVFGLIAVMAFTLILFDRSDPVYLWVGSLFLVEVVTNFLTVLGIWSQTIGITQLGLFNDGLLTTLTYAGWVMVWWVWFGRQRPVWTPLAAAALAVLDLIAFVVGQQMFVGLVPHQVAAAFLSASIVVRLLFLALQLWIVFQGIRRQGLEGYLVLPAVLLWGVSTFTAELSVLHIPIRWALFGLSFRLGTFSSLLLSVVVAVLLVRRLIRSIQSQRQMALDVKQAQEVQQVILPQSRLAVPGLVVESEYRPAREVGGDFFQIIPHASDGSLLIVAGDVTGKGLKAGMLVALLVGAIRSTAETDRDPVKMLAALNRRMLGRGDAQATCLALRIDEDGSAILANAGHLPPYLNGEPLEIEGALPLGMVQDVEFSVLRFQLKTDDRLVLISDGIAEATDVDGHLFGFERIREVLGAERSAVELADAAQRFGQEDDISIISITRGAVAEPAVA